MPISIPGASMPTMAQLMLERPDAALTLIRQRMLCVGCAFARFCNLSEACRAHGNSELGLRAALLSDHSNGTHES